MRRDRAVSAYRTPAEVDRDNAIAALGGEPKIRMHPFNLDLSHRIPCPFCQRRAEGTGRLCLGRRPLFGDACPSVPHFHPRCSSCHGTWLMASALEQP